MSDCVLWVRNKNLHTAVNKGHKFDTTDFVQNFKCDYYMTQNSVPKWVAKNNFKRAKLNQTSFSIYLFILGESDNFIFGFINEYMEKI